MKKKRKKRRALALTAVAMPVRGFLRLETKRAIVTVTLEPRNAVAMAKCLRAYANDLENRGHKTLKQGNDLLGQANEIRNTHPQGEPRRECQLVSVDIGAPSP